MCVSLSAKWLGRAQKNENPSAVWRWRKKWNLEKLLLPPNKRPNNHAVHFIIVINNREIAMCWLHGPVARCLHSRQLIQFISEKWNTSFCMFAKGNYNIETFVCLPLYPSFVLARNAIKLVICVSARTANFYFFSSFSGAFFVFVFVSWRNSFAAAHSERAIETNSEHPEPIRHYPYNETFFYANEQSTEMRLPTESNRTKIENRTSPHDSKKYFQ